MNNLIIVGAGGFGLEAAGYAEDIALATGAFTVKGFLDDTKQIGTQHARYPVLGPVDSPVDESALYVIAVGLPEARKKLAEKLAAQGAKFTSLLHPQSYIASSAQIGIGSIIAPFVSVGPEVRIGRHCLLNLHAGAGHESVLGDYCVVSPYAGVHGQAVVGEGVFIGSNVCVTARVKIGNNARIAAGSVVYNDIPANALALGNPAAFRKDSGDVP